MKKFKEMFEAFSPETLIKQLGGAGKLQMMIGAKDFLKDKNSLSFKFKGSKKANYVKITLNPKDLYDVSFKKIRGMKVTDVKDFKDLDVSQLKPTFEKTTELYLSL
jgi:hypothetical protein